MEGLVRQRAAYWRYQCRSRVTQKGDFGGNLGKSPVRGTIRRSFRTALVKSASAIPQCARSDGRRSGHALPGNQQAQRAIILCQVTQVSVPSIPGAARELALEVAHVRVADLERNEAPCRTCRANAVIQ